MDFLKGLIDGIDPASLLPDLEAMFETLVTVSRIAVMICPLVLLVLGLIYFFLAPREANHTLGFRCWWGMSSVEAWRFTQKLAGGLWAGMGLILGVIALVSGFGYKDMGQQELLDSAVGTMVWQLILVLISIVVINLVLIVLFDRKGYRRGTAPRKK